MRKGSITNTAASVRHRLLNLSQARGADYNALLTQYAIERFLYRLSKSKLADRFVLKGAMLFRVWAADLHRPTKDLDLLGFGDSSPEAVADAVRQIISTAVADDGLRFDPASVTAREIREEQEYGGIRTKFVAMLGNARIPMQVDVGFGDSIIPKPKVEAFPTLLDQDVPKVRMYPVETVIAEKLEAIVKLGMANSRMRDFYDLLVILRRYDPDSYVLAEAIAATFRRRRTRVPEGAPTGLSDEFARDPLAQRRWPELLQRLQIKDAPEDLGGVVKVIWKRVELAMIKANALTLGQ
ncbi:MAG: nucleotidyl transferase AbiEii/AbiGii toxin family protein [Planctomycetes bacterium]|nr:nucleotidyl transferase AbiEii/AbiGii toxin family protein [Planctomycetota bacterium]